MQLSDESDCAVSVIKCSKSCTTALENSGGTMLGSVESFNHFKYKATKSLDFHVIFLIVLWCHDLISLYCDFLSNTKHNSKGFYVAQPQRSYSLKLM